MCIAFLYVCEKGPYKYIVGSNRDEYFDRPALDFHFWEDAQSRLFGGKDLEAQGTWFGVRAIPRLHHNDGSSAPQFRFALLTNFREKKSKEQKTSRGKLVTDFVQESSTYRSHIHYGETLQSQADCFNGYNLIVGDLEKLVYMSNRSDKHCVLEAGIYGLSNSYLDAPWKKIEVGKKLFEDVVHSFLDDSINEDIVDNNGEQTEESFLQELMKVMSRQVTYPNDPHFVHPNEPEEEIIPLSSIFVKPTKFQGVSSLYGTRSQCTMLIRADGSIKAITRNLTKTEQGYEWNEIPHNLLSSRGGTSAKQESISMNN
mmetsp:Transcript_3145/g.3556  ORF Transcript_3145/g.3556 Transcript_3145/m.3556 type:complete len:314 (+) Transcript_3145:94-1035(+)